MQGNYVASATIKDQSGNEIICVNATVKLEWKQHTDHIITDNRTLLVYQS